ncbi:hypothetical protein BC832DRAFT_568588 [Gaertneriomyces semiglobifer]|nr:hypothetical protein BC832DRAFT_568588 [Gaertneriomyces semiglobifer]
MKVMELYAHGRAVLEVEFFDEVGTGLGPTLEFYDLVAREVMKPDGCVVGGVKCRLWREAEFMFPRPAVDGEKEMNKCVEVMRMLGSLVARAVVDGRTVEMPLHEVFLEMVIWKQRYDVESVTWKRALMRRLKRVDRVLWSSLKRLLSMKREEVEGLALEFVLPGYDLPLGEGMVTGRNVEEYVWKVVDATVGSGVEYAVGAFREGFERVVSTSVLRGFEGSEVQMVCGGGGEEDWSLETLRDALKTDHGYNPNSPSILYLLTVLSSYTPLERREFLSFLTGSTRLPIGGWKTLTPSFTVVKKVVDDPDRVLPSVMTCVNYLKLPEYKDVETLRDRLGVACREGRGCFHLS